MDAALAVSAGALTAGAGVSVTTGRGAGAGADPWVANHRMAQMAATHTDSRAMRSRLKTGCLADMGQRMFDRNIVIIATGATHRSIS